MSFKLRIFRTPCLAALSLAALALPGSAQAQSAPPEAAQIAPNPADFATTALRIVQALEAGGAAQLWDSSSPALRGLVPRAQFDAIAQQRKATYGALQNVEWRSIVRSNVLKAQGQLPAGEYVTVNFAGVGKNGKVVTETISFILDSDRNWRLIGIGMN